MIKKKISFSTSGQRADVGDLAVMRLLPNRYADAIGPFIFLDHLIPTIHSANEARKTVVTAAHPHRGIATLTYVLHGEAEHFDSLGNHQTVNSGGIQWMNAGNGIVHDERFNIDSKSKSLLTHGFQFWINLPASTKAKKAEYMALHANEVPKIILHQDVGWLKLLVGKYNNYASLVPIYTEQFLYHLHLKAGQKFILETNQNYEYACFLPLHNAEINNQFFNGGEFVEFDKVDGLIEFVNPKSEEIDILIFGGESYTEPIIAQGPFVMNSYEEIATAYRDYMAGKYGDIIY